MFSSRPLIKAFFVLLLPFSLAAQPHSVSSSAQAESIHLKYGIPGDEGLLILLKENYVIGYDPAVKTPAWTAHRLAKDELKSGRDRVGRWRSETAVPEEARAVNKDYVKSGYARGHLVPSADMVRSAKAMQDTFVFSNCAPQVQDGFNGGIWAQLEKAARNSAKAHGEVWIYSGLIYDSNDEMDFDYIGDGVGVPTRWYKIIFIPGENKATAFLFENKKYSGNCNDPKFRVPIDKIEEITGLNYLHKLPDELEDKIEAAVGDPI